MQRTGLRGPAALLSVALLAVACGPAPSPSPTPTVAPTAAPTITSPSPAASPSSGPTSLNWTKVAPTDLAETARLAVPLDYTNPGAGSIDLVIARRPAADPDPTHRIGVLFINPGGPGGPAVGMANSSSLDAMIPQFILDRFDVIAWDPRGVGLSRGLGCPDSTVTDRIESLDPSPTTTAEVATYRAAFDDLASQCQARNADILPYLSDANTARDMDSIRVALGEDQISYLGWSNGTFLGYRYATLFPTHLRAAVLDGPVDPTEDLVKRDLDQSRGFELAFQHFLGVCAKASACPFHGGGDPGKAYDALIAKLESKPLGTELNAGQAVTGALTWLYGRDYPGLAAALHAAEQGNGLPLRSAANSYYQGGLSFGSYVGIVCLDVAHATTNDQVATALTQARKASPRFGPLIMLGDQYGCLDWPVPTDTAVPTGVPAGLPPILIIASTWDPATPPWGGDALAKALGTGVVLTRDGVGHTSGDANVSSDCLRTAVVAYLEELAVPAAGTVCEAGPPDPWP